MTTTTITVNVTSEEKIFMQAMAEFYDMSLSDLLKKYSMEALEDEYDTQTAEVAYKKFVNSGQQSDPIEKVMEDLGLDE